MVTYITAIWANFPAIWYILYAFGIFCHFLVIFFARFGMLYQEKSGTTGLE
jgi:hypothetical protein